MPAIDVFLLNHSMTIPLTRPKRDGKFEAEDCTCLSFLYRRWPHPPVRRPYLDPLVGLGTRSIRQQRDDKETQQHGPVFLMTANSKSPTYGALDIGFQSTIKISAG